MKVLRILQYEGSLDDIRENMEWRGVKGFYRVGIRDGGLEIREVWNEWESIDEFARLKVRVDAENERGE